MNHFRQYLPNGVETDTAEEEFDFETTEELLENPVVREHKEFLGESFLKYSISEETLIAEIAGGKDWCIIGFIKDPAAINLPTWIHPDKRLRRSMEYLKKLRDKRGESR